MRFRPIAFARLAASASPSAAEMIEPFIRKCQDLANPARRAQAAVRREGLAIRVRECLEFGLYPADRPAAGMPWDIGSLAGPSSGSMRCLAHGLFGPADPADSLCRAQSLLRQTFKPALTYALAGVFYSGTTTRSRPVATS